MSSTKQQINLEKNSKDLKKLQINFQSKLLPLESDCVNLKLNLKSDNNGEMIKSPKDLVNDSNILNSKNILDNLQKNANKANKIFDILSKKNNNKTKKTIENGNLNKKRINQEELKMCAIDYYPNKHYLCSEKKKENKKTQNIYLTILEMKKTKKKL